MTNGWDLVQDNNSFENEKQQVEFLKVPVGRTKVRILEAAPHAYQEYWSNRGNGGKGTSIPYLGKGVCLLEQENKEYLDEHLPKAKAIKDPDKRKKEMRKVYANQPWKLRQKFAINVIDRTDGQVKVLDKGLAVFRELKKYAQDAEYGDLRNYDVTVERSGEGLTTEYSVIPARSNTPLTDEEKAMELYDIETYRDFSHFTPEQILAVAKGATWQEVADENSPTEEDIEETNIEVAEEEIGEEMELDEDAYNFDD